MLPVAIKQPYPAAFSLQPLWANPQVSKQVTQDYTPYLLDFSKIPSPVPSQNTPWVRPWLSTKSATPIFKAVLLLLLVYPGSLLVANSVAQMDCRVFRIREPGGSPRKQDPFRLFPRPISFSSMCSRLSVYAVGIESLCSCEG